MAAPKKPAAPQTLAAAGKKLWQDIVKDYDLRPDELRILEDACAATDMITEMRKAWVSLGRPYMASGSMGQPVEHPLVGSIDKQRKTRKAFLVQLKLPDDLVAAEGAGTSGAPKPDDRATKARAAAQARWSRRGA
jgi:hypothetical protein